MKLRMPEGWCLPKRTGISHPEAACRVRSGSDKHQFLLHSDVASSAAPFVFKALDLARLHFRHPRVEWINRGYLKILI